MQPNTVTINNVKYQTFTNSEGVNFPVAPVNTYALRRVFNLIIGIPKTINFADLQGFWEIESCYISSPQDSEIFFEIVDASGLSFYQDVLVRGDTPYQFPVVLVNNTLTIRLTARRSIIGLALIYLKPAYLSHTKDF